MSCDGDMGCWRLWRALIVALLFVAAMTVSRPQTVLACTCATVTSADAYNWADHVFQGRVAEVELLPLNPNMQARARLEITTVWKGELVSEVFVEGGTGAECRIPWQEGKTYIVIAQESNSGALRTYACQGTGTGLVSHAPDPVAAYGAGTPVPDTAPAHDNVINRTSSPSWPDGRAVSLVTISITVAGVAFVVALISRRRLR